MVPQDCNRSWLQVECEECWRTSAPASLFTLNKQECTELKGKQKIDSFLVPGLPLTGSSSDVGFKPNPLTSLENSGWQKCPGTPEIWPWANFKWYLKCSDFLWAPLKRVLMLLAQRQAQVRPAAGFYAVVPQGFLPERLLISYFGCHKNALFFSQ